MRKEQFDESVTRSLYQAARNLELNETKRGLERRLGNQMLRNLMTRYRLQTMEKLLLKQGCGRTFRPMCQRDCFLTT